MNFKHVTVAGSGVLGSQIAFQVAFKGFDVTIYDINDEAIKKAKERIEILKGRYKEEVINAKDDVAAIASRIHYNSNLLPNIDVIFQKEVDYVEGEVEAGYKRIRFSSDLKEAVKDADLVIEAVPELISVKEDFYKKLGEVAPAKTIFATNSSTLVPSQFAHFTGRPEKFLALHFANEIWKNNTAEIMGHKDTDPAVYKQLVEFAGAIGMVPLEVKKEQPGYILNSILVPFLEAAQMLLLEGVADAETIDKTWMLATGSPQGPFATLDVVGITTAYNIMQNYAQTADSEDKRYARMAEMLKRDYIDKGKLGVATGEGFYKYPNPSFKDPSFLKA
ncbi:3-hydroxybutyryl-CoA dehydrogenase [Listeria floridensis FSL S10-1187]|uniref:3-hydroxybutyryl-CoA dehydrogenase n=1 Tax=Listeria floridensis FSL S10-1187 TaxID=1265817 RepID=A0ABP3AYU2_9LIST|nr:3-hydroxyacyl-CoA dehydrogenase [Listeria floridensis]EUJ30931.1 3-hydroxybutyryl-CoA dehydrogenase [Listeria floridensis FSL S10-1187]